MGMVGDKGPASIKAPSWASSVPVSPDILAAPHLRRFRMGRKYLEVFTAKMILGMRKKVHQARQNQKAFWKGCEASQLAGWWPPHWLSEGRGQL